MQPTAYTAGAIFDGEKRHEAKAVLVENGKISGLIPVSELASGVELVDFGPGLLAPGFIDAQVNGGGGLLLNDGPSVAAMATIADAHVRFGTTALLPTLITDTPAITAAAVSAAAEAVRKTPGVIGLHLEGPHLAPARKGAHDAGLMHPVSEADADRLIAAREAIGLLMTTIAVEQIEPRLIRKLTDAGVIISLGHSDAGYDKAAAAIDAGARGITHLFNAMSPLTHREPGLVGAALDRGEVWCGVIADGFHVHPAALSAAIRAKRGPGRCFLVTDAMSTVGSDIRHFTLNGREILRADGRLTLADGTLAGADIDMMASVRFAADKLGLGLEEAIRMATVYPAEFLRQSEDRGRIRSGAIADLTMISDALEVTAVVRAGSCRRMMSQ